MLPVLSVLVGVTTSCDSVPTSRASVSARDSAGIRIVENVGSTGAVAPWSVAPEPILRVGWDSGEPQFQSIRSGFIDTDGRVVASDARANLIYLISPGGDSFTTLGGAGDGPGEFRRIGTVFPLSADSFLVADVGSLRVTVYAGDEYAYDEHIASRQSNAMYDPVGRTTGGAFVLFPIAYALRVDDPEGWKTYPILRTSDFTSVDTIAVVPLFYTRPQGDMNLVRPFGQVAYTGDGIAHAVTDEPQVTWSDAGGRVTQIARWDPVRRQVDDADWELAERNLRGRSSPDEDPAELDRRVAEWREDFSGPVPFFRSLHVDRGGNVWLGEYDFARVISSRFHVVSARGEWLGSVAFPSPIRMLDITDTRVLGVETDELDVQGLVVYELVKPDE